jgi:threonine synthase
MLCASCSHAILSRGIWRYAPRPPIGEGLTLGEGCTPIIAARTPKIVPHAGRLLLKVETGNPSGSFKDRGSALVLTGAVNSGCSRVAIASTGNAAASTAAYAARLGLQLAVIVPGSSETPKLWQVTACGGVVRKVEGGFDAAERVYNELTADGWYPAGSDNPLRTEGTKTLAFEIHEQLEGTGPDRVIAPIGTGSLIVGLYRGYLEIAASGGIAELPRIDGVQMETVTPLADQVRGLVRPHCPSVATGINIQRALLAREALEAITESGGSLHSVTDAETIDAHRDLALLEGIRTEATGAVGVAAYRKAVLRGEISPSELVVALITGSLKTRMP